jgi:HSP20 family protein|tara:strand:+ start:17 stop:430 length:414 start_codon:yes stop_codon:yes gene_type:complete
MGTLTTFGTSPFDILFRNFFEQEGEFAPFNQIRVNHPVDIYESDKGLNIDIACVGLTKKDINLTIEGDILKVEYKKSNKETELNYIQRNIAKRSFNFGWRISRKFDLSNLDAKLQNGLLQLHAPYSEDSKPKSVTIK